MKYLSKSKSAYLLLFTLLGLLWLSPELVQAQDDDDDGGDNVNFQVFYDQLGDQGTWIQTDQYGYVWQPNVSDDDWRPYTRGHWVYTDEGWTWASDESWGWATYHYGRWVNLDDEGWVWVPGYRWAPAWVSWRYGGGYSGWAPLPPETMIGVEYVDEDHFRRHDSGGLSLDFHFGGDIDVNFSIGAGCYNFCQTQDLGDPDLHRHFINHNNNYGIINRTTNVTNINVNRTTIINNYNNSNNSTTINNNNSRTTNNRFAGVQVGGPPIAAVNQVARTPVQQVKLVASTQAGPNHLTGNSFAVFTPKLRSTTPVTAQPKTVAKTLAVTQVNHGDNVTHPLRPTRLVAAVKPTATQIQKAHEAQAHAPAEAKLARPQTASATTAVKPATETALHPEAQTQPSQHPQTQDTTATVDAQEKARQQAEQERARQEATAQHPAQSDQSSQAAEQERARQEATTQHPAQSDQSSQAAEQERARQEATTQHPAQSDQSSQAAEQERARQEATTQHPAQSDQSSQAAAQERARQEAAQHAQQSQTVAQERARQEAAQKAAEAKKAADDKANQNKN